MGNCGGIEMETRAFSGRYATTSKSSIAGTNAARSMGARGDDLAVGDRGFIDEGRAGVLQVRLDAPPAGGALAASQAGIRKDPWAVADRGDNLTSRRRLLNEADRRGIATQRIGVPDAARNDHHIIVLGGGVLQMPIEPDPAAGSDKGNRHDVRFTHSGNLESEKIRVAGLFGRDQVNLRTARPEMVQDSGQLDLLDAVGSDDSDLPAGMEVGVVGRP